MTHWNSPLYRSRDDDNNQAFQRPQNQEWQAGEKDMLCPTADPCQLVAMCEIRPRSTPDVAKKYRDRAERPNGGPRTADNTTWLCWLTRLLWAQRINLQTEMCILNDLIMFV